MSSHPATSSRGTQRLSTRVSVEPEITDQLLPAQVVGHVVLSKLTLLTKIRAGWKCEAQARQGPSQLHAAPHRANCTATHGAVEDGKHLRVRGAVEWLVVDGAHAFHNTPIDPSERQFRCGMVGARLIDFKVPGMVGESSPNMWGQSAAAIGRVVSSVLNVDELRCEICVDDPLLAAGRSLEENSLSPDGESSISAAITKDKLDALHD